MSSVSSAVQQLRCALDQGKEIMSQTETATCIESICGIFIELKTHFNMCLPIYHLPESILILIFQYATTESNTYSLETCTTHPDLDIDTLISLTHICRDWRFMLLNCPGLWTRLVYHGKNDARFAMLVTRTMSLPLDIILIYETHKTDHEDYSCLNDYAPRMRHLQISVIDKNGMPRLSHMLSSLPFTSLECLKICHERSVLEDYSRHYAGVSFEEVLISGTQTSHLRAMALDWMSVSPFIPANHFPNLTHLYIRWRRPVENALFSFLSHTPRVECLSFQDISSIIIDWFSVPPSIVMSKCVPSSALIRFNQADLETLWSGDEVDAFWLLFNDTKRSMHDAKHLEVNIERLEERFVLVESPSQGLWMESILYGPQEYMLATLLTLQNFVSLSNVTSLVLSAGYSLEEDCTTSESDYTTPMAAVSQSLFHAFLRLSSLCLCISVNTYLPVPPYPANWFIPALTSSPPACPDLHSLTVVSNTYVGDNPEALDTHNTAAVDLAAQLTDLVQARRAAGIPLRRLVVYLYEHTTLSDRSLDNDMLEVLETRRKLYVPLADLVEEFDYGEPGATIMPEIRQWRVHDWLPDNKFWVVQTEH